MEWLIKLCFGPISLVLWALKVMLWIAGVILAAFLNLLFGPLPSEWHKQRKRRRYW